MKKNVSRISKDGDAGGEEGDCLDVKRTTTVGRQGAGRESYVGRRAGRQGQSSVSPTDNCIRSQSFNIQYIFLP